MRFFRPGLMAGCLYPDAIFRIETAENILYLTFDDGPDDVSTPGLLAILKKHSVPAMFFCTGKASVQFPHLMRDIRDQGHFIGNHTFSHFDGWKTRTGRYINDVLEAVEFTSEHFFRPPFGRMGIRQYLKLKEKFQIVFWDVMPYDFDTGFGKEKTLAILKSKIRPGSVIVLHDSKSSCANLILDEFLGYAVGEGYRFEIFAPAH
jgi:peptidoglycan/xylan/chitin deacetylase (PgdA/CDA1 family)